MTRRTRGNSAKWMRIAVALPAALLALLAVGCGDRSGNASNANAGATSNANTTNSANSSMRDGHGGMEGNRRE